MKSEGRAALVTGAAGTVGSEVVRRLAGAGARVRAMVHSPSEVPGAAEVFTADLTDADAVRQAVGESDLVVHCAAALSDDWEENRATNVRGTRTLLDALLDAGTRRLIHISTISVYDVRGRQELDETTPLWSDPDETNAYSYTKAEAERRVREARERGLEAVILRPGVILSTHPKSQWGPRAFDRARESDEPLFPLEKMPYVHVENLAEAVLLAAARAPGEGEAYNVIDGTGPTEDYLKVVYSALGRDPPPLPSDLPTLSVNAEKVRRDLGYDPPLRWEEFLDEMARRAEGS